jgi:ribosomal-protein-alanine N-acetyltransferase
VTDAPHLLSATPVLASLDIARSVDFFCTTLGFAPMHAEPGVYGIVTRDGVQIHFWACADRAIAEATSCRVRVRGIDLLYAEVAPMGIVHPHAPLAAKPWGTREFGVLDPDGNLITFVQWDGPVAGGASPPRFAPLVLHTPRLALRFLDAGDAEALFAIFSDPAVMRYWATGPWTALEQAQTSLRDAQRDYRSGAALRLGIEIDGEPGIVGTCTVFGFHPTSRRAEFGYALAQRCWGRGYMHEALGAFLKHAFGPLNLHRLEADIDPRNASSARALERHGFQREGLLRERWIVDGEICDTVLYGLLAHEFQARLDLV